MQKGCNLERQCSPLHFEYKMRAHTGCLCALAGSGRAQKDQFHMVSSRGLVQESLVVAHQHKYLKSQKGFEGFGHGATALAMSALLMTIDKDYKNNPEIKWNFTKFVIDREGNVVARFEPTADMKKVEECVASLI